MLVGENAENIQGQHPFNIDQVFGWCSTMMEPETIDGPCVSLSHQRKDRWEREKKISVLIRFVSGGFLILVKERRTGESWHLHKLMRYCWWRDKEENSVRVHARFVRWSKFSIRIKYSVDAHAANDRRLCPPNLPSMNWRRQRRDRESTNAFEDRPIPYRGHAVVCRPERFHDWTRDRRSCGERWSITEPFTFLRRSDHSFI